MNKTVIGAFENNSEALQAKSELLAAGFPEQSIDLHYSLEQASDASPPNDNPGFMEAIRSLFTWDIEHYRDENYGDHYVEAVRRGHAVLAITVDESEVERACELMDSAGALDIDEKVSDWRSQGYIGGQLPPSDNSDVSEGLTDTVTTSVASNEARSRLNRTSGEGGSPSVGLGTLDSDVNNSGLNTNLNQGLGAGYEDQGMSQPTSRNNVRVVPHNQSGRGVPRP